MRRGPGKLTVGGVGSGGCRLGINAPGVVEQPARPGPQPDRLLGIGNVTLISSDKAFPTTVLQSIARPRDIREMIRARAYQISQRQLFTRAT